MLVLLASLACTVDYGIHDLQDLSQAPLGGDMVRGRICDPGGGWVVGARVWIDVGDRIIESETGADGWFTLTGVPDGDHTVQVKKGSFSTSFPVTVDGAGAEVDAGECLDPESVEIAVIAGDYDSVEQILDNMGLEYDFYPMEQTKNLVLDPDKMAQYDILFFNCGANDLWMEERPEVGANLKAYVAQGGGVYASDWAYQFVEAAVPGGIRFFGNDGMAYDAAVGMEGHIQADVLDGAMQQVVGETANLTYDLGGWVVPLETSGRVLIEGPASLDPWMGGSLDGVQPLAVELSHGQGTFIFTTFHNEQQLTLDMEALLREMIFSL